MRTAIKAPTTAEKFRAIHQQKVHCKRCSHLSNSRVPGCLDCKRANDRLAEVRRWMKQRGLLNGEIQRGSGNDAQPETQQVPAGERAATTLQEREGWKGE